MPIVTKTAGDTQFYSGVLPNTYIIPNIRTEPTWVSQWKFDDISSGSGLDSQNQNHLKTSGTLTQVVGHRQASGVQFNGTDSCFYLEWYEGSGIGDLIRTTQDPYPGNPDGVVKNTIQNAFYGFMCSIYVDDFSSDQIILSKWNEIGNDREYMIGISPSGGIFLQQKKENTTTIIVSETDVVGGIVPSGEWFDFAFYQHSINSTNSTRGPGWYVTINDTLWASSYGSNGAPEETGSSGIFCIGAADVNGTQPSGFFTGRMEDFRWFNGAVPSMSEYNAFVSGIPPLASYPNTNDLNPYFGMHFQLDTVPSGAALGSTDDRYQLVERKFGQNVYASGSQFHEDSFTIKSGPFDGEYGDSVEFIGPTPNIGTAFFVRPNAHITPLQGGVIPKGSFTVMNWVFPEWASALDSMYLGWRALSSPEGPFTVGLDNMRPQIFANYDNNQRPGYLSTQAISSGVWSHVAFTVNLEQGIVDSYISGIWNRTDAIGTSGLWLRGLHPNGSLRVFHQLTNTTAYALSGMLDEVAMFHYAMPSGDILNIYNSQSGFFTPSTPSSDTEGAYIGGIDISRSSGVLGAYVIVGPTAGPGTVGGYISGVPFQESKVQGSYIVVGPTASSTEGGYIKGILGDTQTLGGWLRSSGVAGAVEAGYIRGVETVDQTSNFVAFYNIIGRDKQEFDAQVQIAKSLGADFDAMAVLFRDEKKPGTLMVNPPIAFSGNTGSPVTVNFEARASGLQDKSIARTFWFFSDDTSTSGSTITSSGTYSTEHTFAESGIFDVLFIALDNKGLINSSRTLVNTAVGATLPEIRLTATPESGIAPLEVAFSGIIDSAPTEIRDEYIYFGDGTRTPSVRNINKLYPVIGCYIPCYRVRDAEGYIVTDTIVIGANN